MAGRLAFVPAEAAFSSLLEAVREAKATDALAPLTVVVSSPRAAGSLRRRLASERVGRGGGHGFAGVRFVTPLDLASALAERRLVTSGRRRLSRTLLCGAIRAELRQHPGPFAAIVDHSATDDELARIYEDLRFAGEGAATDLAATGWRSREIARLCLAVRQRVAAQFFDDADVFAVACESLKDGPEEVSALGAAIWYLPDRLRPPEAALVHALTEVLPLLVVVAALGDAAADVVSARIAGAFAGAFAGARRDDGDVQPDPLALLGPLPFDEVLEAPDPPSEVRAALSLVLEVLQSGVRPERCAIVVPESSYLDLLSSGFGEFGLVAEDPAEGGAGDPPPFPWQSGPWRPLAETARAVFVRDALRLAAESRFERGAVMAWLAAAPLLGPGRRLARVAEWDRASRLAGVIAGGPGHWHWHLDGLAADPERGGAAADLLLAIDQLFPRLAAAREAGTFAELAAWCAQLLEQHLVPGSAPDGEGELAAVIADLANLDAVEPGATLEGFRRAFEQAVGRTTVRPSWRGGGVLVGRPEDLIGGSFELVCVLGCVEGAVPRRVRGGPVLDTAGRERAGLETAGPLAVAAERRRLGLALAAGRRRVALVPERDGPGGAHRQRSRWLPALPTRRVPSVERAVAAAIGDPPSLPELECRALVVSARHGGDLGRAPLAAALGLTRGLAAVEARATRRFGAFAGKVAPGPALERVGERVLSPTSLEAYATCPFRYFLSSVLSCEALDEPERRIEIDPRDRGTIVHEILQRYVEETIGAPKGEAPDGSASLQRLQEISEEVFEQFRRRGRTGKDVLFDLERRRMLALVEEERRADALRRAEGFSPLAVEHRFGYDDVAPVQRMAAGVPVRFRGSIDRVDRGPSGRLRVVDYKVSSPSRFRGLEEDPVDRGRHLQLPIYAAAARQAFAADGDEPVAAAFRVLAARPVEVEILVDKVAEDRLDEVLGVLVDNIRAGRFPLRPGEVGFDGHENCKYCDYTSLCPTGRGGYWANARLEPSLASFVALADGTSEPRPDEAVAGGDAEPGANVDA